MDARDDQESTLVPPWVRELDVPVWITGDNNTLIHLNRRAEKLLGHRWRDRSCHTVVGAVDSRGRPLCGVDCPIRCRLRQGGKLRPVRMLVSSGQARHSLVVLPIHVSTAAGDCIVHCALEADRLERVEDYFRTIIHRGQSTTHAGSRIPWDPAPLTAREKEVLHHLAAGESLVDVGAHLFVSYATVRNHVQHILGKLGVHSIVEAVACDLLGQRPAAKRTPSSH